MYSRYPSLQLPRHKHEYCITSKIEPIDQHVPGACPVEPLVTAKVLKAYHDEAVFPLLQMLCGTSEESIIQKVLLQETPSRRVSWKSLLRITHDTAPSQTARSIYISYSVHISPNHSYIVAYEICTLRIWNAETDRIADSNLISPNGSYIVASAHCILRIWNTETGCIASLVCTLRWMTETRQLAYHVPYLGLGLGSCGTFSAGDTPLGLQTQSSICHNSDSVSLNVHTACSLFSLFDMTHNCLDERHPGGLQWASTRVTMSQEDAAYALLGMFSIQYPLIKVIALWRLLQDIPAQSGTACCADDLQHPSMCQFECVWGSAIVIVGHVCLHSLPNYLRPFFGQLVSGMIRKHTHYARVACCV